MKLPKQGIHGYAEVTETTNLNIYGDAFQILTNLALQSSIESISFHCVKVSQITDPINAANLRNFRRLRRYTFLDNDIRTIEEVYDIDKMLKGLDYRKIINDQDETLDYGSITIA